MLPKSALPTAFTEVTSDNIHDLITPILDAIRQAQYIALDTEFSGHCPKIVKNMDQRYQDLANVIRTHTLFSFGLTTIAQDSTTSSYQLTNIEFLTRNQQTYQVDPTNIKFLAENGIDFGRIFRVGIPFKSGSKGDNETDVLRQLWHKILHIIREYNVPVVVHNGLLDIMYLYQSFFASLPESLSSFVADLVEMFPAGIYDTKHLALSVADEPKTYLAYLYCKYLRLQQQQGWSLRVLPTLIPAMSPEYSPLSAPCSVSSAKSDLTLDDTTESASMKRRKRAKKTKGIKHSTTGICNYYSTSGWCQRGNDCHLSHDLDLILDHDMGIKRLDTSDFTDKSTTTEITTPEITGISESGMADQESTTAGSEGSVDTDTPVQRRDHSSHFDAYMTAFIFCHFLSTIPSDKLSVHINRLNLMRLGIPLRLVKSNYAKPTTEWTRIKAQLWPSS